MNFNLSSDQQRVLDNLLDWFKDQNKTRFITVGGYAGTGKTTLIGILRQQLLKDNKKLKIAFCSYTGKAARVLRHKLLEADSLKTKDSLSTIHSLIYSPIEDERTQEIIGWKKKEEIEADLIVIDEASMVDFSIWQDLLSFGQPIIAVGDHGQLPPIREN
ncbi:MAG: AAA family ATPase, partial [Patescibacteria group bacterium]|nr:AAA family ATPase [Patescibacteria group bacterium]